MSPDDRLLDARVCRTLSWMAARTGVEQEDYRLRERFLGFSQRLMRMAERLEQVHTFLPSPTPE